MPDFYKVSNSFRAKDKDGNPKVYKSGYGDLDVWKVYFEGDDQGYVLNKKPGFEGFKKGQDLYGTKDDWRFKQEQAPEGEGPQHPHVTNPAPQGPQGPAGKSGDLEAKIDYLTSLVENFLERTEGRAIAKTTTDVSPTDIDDGPVDLSNINY